MPRTHHVRFFPLTASVKAVDAYWNNSWSICHDLLRILDISYPTLHNNLSWRDILNYANKRKISVSTGSEKECYAARYLRQFKKDLSNGRDFVLTLS